MKEFVRAALRIMLKDLRIEARTGEITITTTMFAVLVTIVSSLAFYTDRATAARVAPGVLWLTITFAGVLAMGRSWSRERDNDVMRALLLAPVPRSALYVGKAAGSLVFLVIVQVVLLPLVAVLFHIDLIPVLGPIALLLLLGTIGLVCAGSLFAVMTVRTSARDLVLSVVLFPLMAPSLLAGVVATRELIDGATLVETFAWIRILGASDLLFFGAGLAMFGLLTRD